MTPLYNVCFAGSRDNYEIPIALYANGMLDTFLTDLYLKPQRGRNLLSRRIQAPVKRHTQELTGANIESHIASFIYSLIEKRGYRFSESSQELLSCRFGTLCSKSNSSILAYAGYAYHAFQSADRSRRKILFQYHPYRGYENTVLRRDELGKAIFKEYKREDFLHTEDERNAEEIGLADKVLCASAFSAKSIQYASKAQKDAVVIPYGSVSMFDVEAIYLNKNRTERAEVLFVGSGIVRKGVHILIEAFKALPQHQAKLTIVSRAIGEDLSEYIRRAKTDNITIRSHISRQELDELFLRANVLVMPSLSEGFGHVILEALSAGCYVIASEATCLPDLGLSNDAARVCRAADVASTRDCLLDAIEAHSAGHLDHVMIGEEAKRFSSWSDFRQKVALHCK